ncbi:MAG: nuclear transport factor 2 family protein [Bacteroidota bacterium]
MRIIGGLFILCLLFSSCVSKVENQRQSSNEDQQIDQVERSQGEETMQVALSFMDAMTKGEMDQMKSFMHEDMIWHNEGDNSLPWIGKWKSKKVILEEFLPLFGSNFKTIKWESEDALSKDDTAAFFGLMAGELTHSGERTSDFSWALRVKVKDGKVILWNWFEDSYEVSRAYHANAN